MTSLCLRANLSCTKLAIKMIRTFEEPHSTAMLLLSALLVLWAAWLATVAFAPKASAQAPLPIVVYNDPRPGDSYDANRKNLLVNSVRAMSALVPTVPTVVSKTPPALQLSARTHIMSVTTLVDLSDDNKDALIALIDRPNSMLVLTAAADTPIDYNNCLSLFLGESPDCKWEPVKFAANLIADIPNVAVTLYVGNAQVSITSFTCRLGIQLYRVANDASSPVYMFQTPLGGWVKLLGFDWGSRCEAGRELAKSAAVRSASATGAAAAVTAATVAAITRAKPTVATPAAAFTADATSPDAATPATISITATATLQIQVLGLYSDIGKSAIVSTGPGAASVQVVYDNTYLRLSSGNRAALRSQLLQGNVVAVVVTPETTQSDVSTILQSLLNMGNSQCTKRNITARFSLAVEGNANFVGAMDTPAIDYDMQPADNTVAMLCTGNGRRVISVNGSSEAAVWEWTVGAGVLRLAATLTPTATPRAPRNAPRPPPPVKVQDVVVLIDNVTMPDNDKKNKLIDGINAITAAPGQSTSPVEGAAVHVAFDSTLVALPDQARSALKSLLASSSTLLSVVVTSAVSDADLSRVLADLTGRPQLSCSSMPVGATSKVDRMVPATDDLRSDGWKALDNTRASKCNIGKVIFGLKTDVTAAIVHDIPVGNTAVRLIGYDFYSGGRGDNRKPLTACAITPNRF
ncbi:hypothetical protein VOLCADRAFT_88596 [Volvox carteri f. nagariensis]|uniref:Uncharacterized protein n=1 Tax=Volvox carteri f. nagariensis TaxID=3068 RepID=D8TPF3_VOLCA|nr:uncharacterized protein VOLCADRAFT_88596 [Volvox carteri f. nagariensis]EFJ50607.1 hypothetical protein VOLCADRAFT_88596 [Volvox carteri f. nagariensis]|eukprot:XP_002948200.1 hypothetical protein VOLCADRAFT_88596 [Volvox carteri f. nagariensis]